LTPKPCWATASRNTIHCCDIVQAKAPARSRHTNAVARGKRPFSLITSQAERALASSTANPTEANASHTAAFERRVTLNTLWRPRLTYHA